MARMAGRSTKSVESPNIAGRTRAGGRVMRPGKVTLEKLVEHAGLDTGVIEPEAGL